MFSQVSSVEVVQAYIDRIQDVNPLINAVVKDRQGPTILLYFTFFYSLSLHFINSKLGQPTAVLLDVLFSFTQVTTFTYYCLTKNKRLC